VRDVIVFGLVVLAFAATLTFHIAIVVGLARRAPRARAVAALVLPPLAPYWGFGQRMRVRSVGWVASVAVYCVARLLQ
jgi:hypothetical protein